MFVEQMSNLLSSIDAGYGKSREIAKKGKFSRTFLFLVLF